MNGAIIAAAGRHSGMGKSADRAFLSLGTSPVLAYSLQAYEKCEDIDAVVLVVRKDRLEAAHGVAQMFGCSKVIKVVAGGAHRQASVAAGLAEFNEDYKVISVHDACRPCITPDLISQTVKAAKRYGSGVAALRSEDTVKLVEKGQVIKSTVESSKVWLTQTPQTFKRELLEKGLAAASKKGLTVADDASAVELISKEVRLVVSSVPSIKIVTADDLTLAAAYLRL